MASRCRGFISGAANIGAVTQGQIEPAFQLDADLHAQPTTWPGPRQPHVDHSGEWARLSEIGDDGCLLVRPITMSPGAPPT
nr:hypothetical protein [Cereibacter changlensis]